MKFPDSSGNSILYLQSETNSSQKKSLSVMNLDTTAMFFGCGFFADNWKLPAYSGVFYLQLTRF